MTQNVNIVKTIIDMKQVFIVRLFQTVMIKPTPST